MAEFYIVFRHKLMRWRFEDVLVKAQDAKHAVVKAAGKLNNPDDWEVDQVWKVALKCVYDSRGGWLG